MNRGLQMKRVYMSMQTPGNRCLSPDASQSHWMSLFQQETTHFSHWSRQTRNDIQKTIQATYKPNKGALYTWLSRLESRAEEGAMGSMACRSMASWLTPASICGLLQGLLLLMLPASQLGTA